MGWPLRGEPAPGAPDTFTLVQEIRRYPHNLDDIRHSAQAFNILHLWHEHPTDIDNDFYFRIGQFLSRPVQDAVDQAEDKLRRFLEHRGPLVVEVGISDLCFVGYEEGDETLPIDRTQKIQLEDGGDPLKLFG